jgi:lipopolysaccharide transport system permease protein
MSAPETASFSVKAVSEESRAVTYVRPVRGWTSLQLKELWRYRELLYFFVWRDVKVRYRQTALGAGWAILQPLFTMVLFTVVFGRLAKIPSEGLPYPVFSYAGLVPWTLFANGLSHASNSLVGNPTLITKVYFPRLALPVAKVLAGLVDFALAFVMLLALMTYYHVTPTANTVWLPIFIILTMITALGLGLWLAAINVQYHDVQYVVPFLIQMWLFATPIAYPASLLPHAWQKVAAINPMYGVVASFRWALLGTEGAPASMILVSSLVSVLLLVSGAYYFRRVEKDFADLV